MSIKIMLMNKTITIMISFIINLLRMHQLKIIKFLISVLDTNTRERVYKSLNLRKAEFINLVHPKA